MKFAHVADMHFDTAFTSLESKKELGDLRRLEQRDVFKKMIEKIKQREIPYLFISGDLYEQKKRVAWTIVIYYLYAFQLIMGLQAY